MSNPQWDKYKNLSEQSKKAVAPTNEFSKSKAIENLHRVQDKVISEAKQTGDVSKIKEANRFAVALEREARFLRHSK